MREINKIGGYMKIAFILGKAFGLVENEFVILAGVIAIFEFNIGFAILGIR